jgi:hypothetical protein
MASSLKGYIPALARLMQTTPAALYERQRALVRAGLLAAGEGRGPGSGVRTTAPAVALLILSVLSTDRLSESDARTGILAELSPANGKRCPHTGRRTFIDAFATLLVGTGQASAVNEITVSRTADLARLKYYDHDSDEQRISEFVGKNTDEPGISVSVSLSHNLLMQISGDVQAIVLESFNREEQRQ